MTKGLVSVIIPVYNDARFLKEAIDSVFAQSISSFEILLIDDGSMNSGEILDISKSYSDKRLRYIRNPKNIGLAASRNVGIKFSNGEYICFLDADDFFAPDKLKVQSEVFVQHPNLWMVFSDEYLVKDGVMIDQTNIVSTYQLPQDTKGILEIYAQKSFIAVFTTLTHRKVFENIGGFEESLRAWEDDDLWFRIMLHGEVKFSPYLSGYRRLHDSNMSANRHKMNYFALNTFYRWVIMCKSLQNNFLKKKIKKRAWSYFKIYFANGIKTLDFNWGTFRLISLILAA